MFDFFGNPIELPEQPLWEYKPAGWQKCPVCEGTGKSKEWTITHPNDCQTCNGHKIINRATGLPPDETTR